MALTAFLKQHYTVTDSIINSFIDFYKKPIRQVLTDYIAESNNNPDAFYERIKSLTDNEKHQFSDFIVLLKNKPNAELCTKEHVLLGYSYLRGIGSEENREKAHQHLVPAAEDKNPIALNLLAFNEPDTEKALSLLKQAAELGFGCAMYNIAIKQDIPAEEKKYLQMAVSLRSRYACTELRNKFREDVDELDLTEKAAGYGDYTWLF